MHTALLAAVILVVSVPIALAQDDRCTKCGRQFGETEEIVEELGRKGRYYCTKCAEGVFDEIDGKKTTKGVVATIGTVVFLVGAGIHHLVKGKGGKPPARRKPGHRTTSGRRSRDGADDGEDENLGDQPAAPPRAGAVENPASGARVTRPSGTTGAKQGSKKTGAKTPRTGEQRRRTP